MLALFASIPMQQAGADSTYVHAQHIDGPSMRYPEESQKRGNEGLIIYRYFIDASGIVSDVQINYSTGDEIMERHLIKWIGAQRYEPALRDGLPVVSWNTGRATFLLTGKSRGASRPFVKQWKRFTKNIGEGDYVAAKTQIENIESMKERSLYEELFLHRAWALYYASIEDEDQAYRYLQTIGGFYKANSPKDETIAPASMFYIPMTEKYKYEIGHLMLGDAAESLSALKEIDPKAGDTKAIESHYDSVIEAVKGKQFWTNGVIKKSPYIGGQMQWSAVLTRHTLELTQVEGVLTDASVSCSDGGVAEISTAEDVAIEIDDSWRGCEIFISGEVGTSFVVAQLPD